MKTKAPPSPAPLALRRRAERRLREAAPHPPPPAVAGSKAVADTTRLLHEVQVHQVELEMQNAELQAARDHLEVLLQRYADLYDFAPIGYFSLDEGGRILQANLTGATLLGSERSRLVRTSLLRFVPRSSQPVVLAFLERVFQSAETQSCESALLKRGGGSIWAHLQGSPVVDKDQSPRSCRVAVSDMSALIEARAAELRLESLTAANRELQLEIERRKAVQDALTSSQRQQTRLLRQSRRMQEQLRHLSHQILRVQEEERKRISRELHDEIAQTLVNIHLQLETLARDTEKNPANLRARIAKTQRLVEGSVNSVHEFARELRPALLDDLGLIPTLHAHLKDFTRRTGLRVRFITAAGVERLNNPRRTALYRVAQAALTNVAQHAQASRVEVHITQASGAIHLEIADDGHSFDVEKVLHARPGRRLGLLGMRERVEMVGGTFLVVSAPGKGTRVRVQMPCNP